MNIVILDSKKLNPCDLSFEDLKKLGKVTVYDDTVNDREEIIKRAKDADVILVVYVKITREIIDELLNLKYIGVLSTGYDNIDLKAAREKNILVTNTPSYGTDAVAQLALALLLEITTRVGHHDREISKGRWSKEGFWYFGDYPLLELKDKTIGVLGLGEIGLACAKIYKAMGMKVLAYNRSQREENKAIVTYTSLDEIFEKSDIIDLHLPLTDETRDIINRENIGKMKDGVIIINTARGGLIDEEALLEAINAKKIFACGLDVVKNEPIADDHPFINEENVYLTPHMGWAPSATRQRLLDIAIENLKAFKKGAEKNRVN